MLFVRCDVVVVAVYFVLLSKFSLSVVLGCSVCFFFLISVICSCSLVFIMFLLFLLR